LLEEDEQGPAVGRNFFWGLAAGQTPDEGKSRRVARELQGKGIKVPTDVP
jgi:hypothetical protein